MALELPKEILVPRWHTAFRELADAGFPDFDDTTTEEAPDANADIVLAGHMCYYHQQSRAFVSLVDPDLLRDQFKPQAIVTLVDDIEHIFKRL